MEENGNKPEQKLPEANFEVSSLSEVKDDKGNGIFHMRTKTKFILLISLLILLSAGALIYLALEKIFAAEIWQLAVWGLCGVLAIYSVFAKSIPTMLLNMVLFFGVSLIPVWQAGHETFRPVIEKFTAEEPAAPIETPVEKVDNPPQVEQEKISAEKNSVEETKTSETVEDKKSAETNSVEEKIADTETKKAENKLLQENDSPALDLPSI